MALAVPKHLRFDVRREGLFDRIAKRFGIVQEWQLGDDAIDDHLYLDDDDVLGDVLATRPEARIALRGLLTRLRANQAKLQWLECANGELVLQVATGFGGRPVAVRDEAVRFLIPLVEALRKREPPTGPARTRAEQLARLPLAVMLAALIVGAGGGIILHIVVPQLLVDPWSLWRPGWIGGGAMLALSVRGRSSAWARRPAATAS